MVDEDVQPTRAGTGRVLGWVSGLGIAIVPWIAGGILASVGAMGPETWSPEATFPWTLLASFVAMLGWIAYGCIRISGFRRGGLLGSAIALALVGVIYVLIRTLER